MPNLAPILTKAKFQGCSVMKMKIFSLNTFLGESTVMIIVVILNFLIFINFQGITGKAWCAKLGIRCSRLSWRCLLQKKRP